MRLHCENEADFIPQPNRPRSSDDRSSSGLVLAGRIALTSSCVDIPHPSSRMRTSGPFSLSRQVRAIERAFALMLLSIKSASALGRS